MHLVSKLLAIAATGALGTHALETSIFTFPSSTSPEDGSVKLDDQVVTEDVARLILELRTESSLQSVLGNVNSDTVDRLNEYSGAQNSLFGGEDSQATPSRNLVLLEGINEAVGMLSLLVTVDMMTVGKTYRTKKQLTLSIFRFKSSQGTIVQSRCPPCVA